MALARAMARRNNPQMLISIIVQARMGSSRLPGKILRTVAGKSLLETEIERLRQIKVQGHQVEVVIATTTSPLDDEVERFCLGKKIEFFRGSASDVLSRYYECASRRGSEIVVRATADCPLIDPEVSGKVIETYLAGGFDYVSNTVERSYPRGLDTEVFSFVTLEKAHQLAKEAPDREHVTRFIYTHPDKFRMGAVKNPVDLSNHRWTVDTAEDFELIKRLLGDLASKPGFRMRDVLECFSRHPDWISINSHIEQKSH
jgi:spore coat polysaccharide biosynthesis protein SpsF